MKVKAVTKRFLFLLSTLTMVSAFVPHGPVHATTNPTISLDANTNAASVSPHLFGANDRFFTDGVGKYDSVNQQVYSDFVTSYNDVGFKTMRYPAGTAGNLFWWQRAVGNGNNTNPDSGLPQIHGKTLGPDTGSFNLDKALQFTESTGTMMTYMYNMNGNPTDAANLVQYLNGTDTSNPFVQLRISNGHAAPYNIKYFEIGNETSFDGQRYWLKGDLGGFSYQYLYVNGGTVSFTKQPVVLKTDWRSIPKGSYKSTGVSGQQVYAAYAPVTAGSDIVYVNDTAWTRVSSFAGYSSTDQVYQIHNTSGLITFGDGTNGMIPPINASITVSYSAYHSGYKDYITAMKAVDPSVKVLSNLHDDATIAALNAANVQFDGMVIHPYTYTGGVNKSLTDYYAQVMGDAANQAYAVKSLQQKLKSNPLSGGIVYPSEFGLGGYPTGYPSFQLSLGDALYTAKVQMSFMQLGLPVATKHALIDQWGTSNAVGSGNQAMINNNYTPGSPYNFSKNVAAYMYQMLVNMSGTTALSAPTFTNMPVYGTNKKAINAIATKNENGDLYLVVMNEDPSNDYTTNVNIANYQTGGTASVWKLGEGNTLDQINVSGQAPSVVNQTSTVPIPGNAFTYTFPAHTLTAIKLTGTVTPPIAVPDAAQAHYQLNESTGSTTADIGGSNRTGTLVATSGGTLNWDPIGKVNGALDFVPTGTNTYGNYYVSIPNFLDPAATDFTMSSWVNLAQASAAGGNQSIFAQEGTTGRSLLYRDVNTGKLKSFLGGVTTTSTGVIPTGTWTHVALVKSGGTIVLYINGAADTTGAVTAESSTGNFRIGAHKTPSATNANWNGALDEVHIVKAALTSTQIQNIYNGLSPIAYYQLNESAGSAAADITGNNHTGSLIANSGGILSWDPTGKVNGALDIAPTGSNTYGDYYASIPNLFNPAATDFTMSAWVRLDQASTAGSNQTIFTQEGTLGRSILFRDVNTGKLRSYLGGVNTNSVGTIPTGTWTHVAVVKNGSTIQLFINGAPDTTANVTAESSTGSFRLGAHKSPTSTNANWNGAIDEVQVFNTALTSTSVQNIYNGITP